MVVKMAEGDVNANNKTSARTSVIERWLKHGDLGNSQPQNGVAAPITPGGFNPLRRRSDDRLGRGSPSSGFSDESYSPNNRYLGSGLHTHDADDGLGGLGESLQWLSIGGERREERNGTTRRVFGGGVDRDNNGGGGHHGFGFGFGVHHEAPPLYEGFNGFDGDVGSSWMGLGVGYSSWNNVGGSRGSLGSSLTHTTGSSRNSSPTFGNENGGQMNFYSGEVQYQYQNPIGGPYVSDVPLWSHPNEHYFNRANGNGDGLRASFGSQELLQQPQSGIGVNMSSPVRDLSVTTRCGVTPVSPSNQSFVDYYEGFNCEDSFIIKGTSLGPAINKRRGGGPRAVDPQHDGWSEIGYLQMLVLQSFRAMAAQEGFVYFMAKDQSGCRNLQRVFEVGTREDVNTIFDNVIDHIVELSTDPFGNYLVQKLLEVCIEEQRRQIVFVMTKEPGDLLRISLNTHGTRVVQKLVETARNRRSVSSLMRALEPGILDLIKDLNGNHVLQSCLKCLGTEDNAFIFDAATRFCIEVSTHRHGCCVMQKCVERSTGYYQLRLVTEILKHAVLLAADPYGNYVIQFIIDQKIHYATNQMTARFKGHYVLLSTQKCGSHVVEKCLKDVPQARDDIVSELLKVSQFERLLQDPYANYVIQSALKITKGNLYNALVHRVRSHNHSLRASPYCKKILSQTMPRK